MLLIIYNIKFLLKKILSYSYIHFIINNLLENRLIMHMISKVRSFKALIISKII